MKLTEEQINQNLACYRKAMLQGSKDGIEVSTDGIVWDKACLDQSMEIDLSYREKSEPKLRPWTFREVPVGAIISHLNLITKTYMGPYLITGVTDENFISYGYNYKDTPEVFLFNFEYSIDQGKTWHPCGVRE